MRIEQKSSTEKTYLDPVDINEQIKFFFEEVRSTGVKMDYSEQDFYKLDLVLRLLPVHPSRRYLIDTVSQPNTLWMNTPDLPEYLTQEAQDSILNNRLYVRDIRHLLNRRANAPLQFNRKMQPMVEANYLFARLIEFNNYPDLIIDRVITPIDMSYIMIDSYMGARAIVV